MVDSSKIVSIHGGEMLPLFQPRPSVIQFLERTLEAARSGEIVGVAAVFVHGDEATSLAWQGAISRSQLGLLEILKADLVDEHRKARE